LTGLKNEMVENEREMVHDEKDAEKTYDQRMTAKNKEVDALSKSIEDKLDRVGRLGVEIASMKDDLEDSGGSLAQDKAFMRNMASNCKTKAAEHEAGKKMRAQEIVALADTIKILNDDDALEIFKKTLPSAGASFLQLQTTAKAMRAQAKHLLSRARSRLPPGHGTRLDFISLALNGRKIGLDKVIGLVDKLVATLRQEQLADDSKKQYCVEQFEISEAKKKELERSTSDFGTAIEETKEGLATLVDEIEALRTGIAKLDKAVAEATQQRKSENAEYKELMSNNVAAKELIVMAKKRLSKFYKPKPALVQQEDDEVAPSFVQLDAAPPPETMAAYTKKAGESGGVLNMMDILAKDLEREMHEGKAEEKSSQEEYEQTMADSAEKRATDSKALGDKEGTKAELQNVLETSTAEKKSSKKELMAVSSYLQTLHAECDWLTRYYDVRKEARADELDALEKASGVLSGADVSLLQRGTSVARTRKFLPSHKRV